MLLYLADDSKWNLCFRRSGIEIRIFWNFYFWIPGESIDPIRSSPCILHSVLADSAWWYCGNRRRDCSRSSEHFLAELASPNTVRFSVEACRFMTGKYSFMMAGLPAAAYAMYHCAKPENRKIVGGLLISAALTSFLTGITEPIEFTFLFIAPGLFILHCGFAGLSFLLMHLLKICIGTTFSCGLIDFTLYQNLAAGKDQLADDPAGIRRLFACFILLLSNLSLISLIFQHLEEKMTQTALNYTPKRIFRRKKEKGNQIRSLH